MKVEKVEEAKVYGKWSISEETGTYEVEQNKTGIEEGRRRGKGKRRARKRTPLPHHKIGKK